MIKEISNRETIILFTNFFNYHSTKSTKTISKSFFEFRHFSHHALIRKSRIRTIQNSFICQKKRLFCMLNQSIFSISSSENWKKKIIRIWKKVVISSLNSFFFFFFSRIVSRHNDLYFLKFSSNRLIWSSEMFWFKIQICIRESSIKILLISTIDKFVFSKRCLILTNRMRFFANFFLKNFQRQ